MKQGKSVACLVPLIAAILMFLAGCALSWYIILPLTLLASIFGMNVDFPFEGGVEAFWTILGVMVVVLVGMVGYFRRRGFL